MPLKRILRGIYGSSLSRVYYIGNFTFTFNLPAVSYFDKVNLPLQSYKAYKKFFKEIRVLVLTFGI